MVGFRIGRVDHIKVDVVPVSARRSVSDFVSRVGPDRIHVARLTIRQQGNVAAIGVETVQLVEFTAANIFIEDEEVTLCGLVGGRVDRVRIESELGARPARYLYAVNLRGIGESRGDQHLAPSGVPTGEASASEVCITLNCVRQRCGDLRNILRNQIFVRNDFGILRITERDENQANDQNTRDLHQDLLAGPKMDMRIEDGRVLAYSAESLSGILNKGFRGA